MLETKLLAGRTGYDIVVPTAPFLQRQIQVGVYRKLDKALLPNLANLDPDLNQRLAANDPGNQYAVIYFWGTSGVGYNATRIAAALPNAPTDSLAMLFDPKVVAHFKECGVSILDAPDEVLESVLLYLGEDTQQRIAAGPQGRRRRAAVDPAVRALHPFLTLHRRPRERRHLHRAAVERRLRAGTLTRGGSRARRLAPLHPAAGRLDDFLRCAGHPGRRAASHATPTASSITCCGPTSPRENATAMRFPDRQRRRLPAWSIRAVYRRSAPSTRLPQERARLHPMASHSLAFSRQLSRMWTRFKTGRHVTRCAGSPPITSTSRLTTWHAPPPKIADNFTRCVMSGRARDTAAGMGAGATHVQTL